MATGIYKELKEVASCEICFEQLEGRKPRQLTCLHVFCEQCLQRLLDTARATDPQTSSINCPVCKNTVEIPGGSAAKLPLFFYVSKLQSILKDIEDRNTICTLCKSADHRAPVTTYCFHCVSGHCEKCRINHDHLFRKHVQIPVSPSTVNSIMCHDHGFHFTHFCMTCSKAICTHCYIGNHSQHKVYDLAYDGKKVQQDLKEFLLSGMKSVNTRLASLEQLEGKLSRDIKATMEAMKHHQEYLLKLVNDQYESLCLQLNQKEADIRNDLAKSIHLVEDAKSCIDRLLKQTDSWHEPVKGIPQARIKNIDKLVTEVKQQMPSFEVGITPQEVKFVRADDVITFGKIVLETSASAIAEECGSRQSHRNEDLQSPDSTCAGSDVCGSFQSELAEARTNLDRMSVSVKPTLLHEIETWYDVRDIDYLDNSQLIVCMSDDLKVYDVNGSEIRHHLSDVCKPCDGQLYSVSVDNNSKCVVVSEVRDSGRPGYLHVYRSDGVTWQYNRRVVCRWPCCVSVTSDGDCVVWSCGDKKLYKYNSRGDEVWSVDTSRYVGGWVVVRGLSVGENGEIVVCFESKVVVYDKDGREIFRLTTTDRQLRPGGVCVGKQGEIVVSDVRSKTILLFNKRYQFIRCLIDLDFTPWWICLYNKVMLAVCGSDRKIHVYKL